MTVGSWGKDVVKGVGRSVFQFRSHFSSKLFQIIGSKFMGFNIF